MAEDIQQTFAEFERGRAQLMNVSAQRQQMQVQSTALAASLEALGKTTEKKVYKAVGNILILSDTAKVKKELADQKESTELRLKTVQKQEDALVEKMNKLRERIEAAQNPQAQNTVSQGMSKKESKGKK
ncbi:prefoldin subunit beta [Patescibacteria group bacterium]|nr:prefoldin subunit beta [Patescibacteria group bacterium]